MFFLKLTKPSKYTILFLFSRGAIVDYTVLNIPNCRFITLWYIYSKSAKSLPSFSPIFI